MFGKPRRCGCSPTCAPPGGLELPLFCFATKPSPTCRASTRICNAAEVPCESPRLWLAAHSGRESGLLKSNANRFETAFFCSVTVKPGCNSIPDHLLTCGLAHFIGQLESDHTEVANWCLGLSHCAGVGRQGGIQILESRMDCLHGGHTISIRGNMTGLFHYLLCNLV